MIEVATFAHTQKLADVVRAFQLDPVAPDYFRGLGEQTLAGERLVLECVRSGLTFIATDHGVVQGALMCVKVPLPFFADKYMAEEIIWYVMPEYRGTTVAAKLFLTWQRAVKQQQELGNIVTAVCHTLDRSPIDLQQHGFRVLQTSFYME